MYGGSDTMIFEEKFGQFTVYRSDVSHAFLYVNFSDPDRFMDGLSDYVLSEANLLNYANTMSPTAFTPTLANYKRLYSTLETFLNAELELLTFDNVSNEIKDTLGDEYTFANKDGETLIQKDKIGKIGEYIFHVLLTQYFRVNCIIPKFRCATDRNMSVFGIDALFFDPAERINYFGESKVCKTIDNAITLVNRSFADYESQISEEYKLVLSNSDVFRLSQEFQSAFERYTEVCISFEGFVKAASISQIYVPAFISHGNGANKNTPEDFLQKMNTKITRNSFFGLDTKYLFISLPIIDKAKMMDVIMRKVVKKSNEYRSKFT